MSSSGIDLSTAAARLADRRWRLNNLYHIQDKAGTRVLFKPNWAQELLYDNMWYCNVVLKARQLGVSTCIIMLFLDAVLFNSDVSAGIIAHTKDDAQQLFKKVKYAYDNLPEEFKRMRGCRIDSAREMSFEHGSSIRVGTSLRSSTLQFLHVSEFGKICRLYPSKAQEIVTGSFNTLAPGQNVFVESTAEGREGYFFNLCQEAQKLEASNAEMSKLDWKFHFFPWWKHPDYILDMKSFQLPSEYEDYFNNLESEHGIRLREAQKYWYCKIAKTQEEDMYREYPSVPSEAFMGTQEGYYYVRQMLRARKERRVTFVPYEEAMEVHTAWDFGYNDMTCIWFFQLIGKEVRLIDYIVGSGESLTYYLGLLKVRGYSYGYHLVPHDAKVHEYSTGMTRVEVASNHGFRFTVVKKLSVSEGIDQVRMGLNKCWFDEKKCDHGIRSLESYQKKWNATLGCWMGDPLHDQWSHGADAFRTLFVGLPEIMDYESSAEEFRQLCRRHRPIA